MVHPQSVAGIIFSSDRASVLLIQRRDVPVWVLPGGGIDKGESAEDAIVREILEETGFTVKVDRLVGDYIPINRLSKRTYLFECFIIGGEAKTSPETKDIRFFSIPLRLRNQWDKTEILERNKTTRIDDSSEFSAVQKSKFWAACARDPLPPLPPPYFEWIEDGLQKLPPLQKKLVQITYFALLKNLILHPLLVLRFLLAKMGLSMNSKG